MRHHDEPESAQTFRAFVRTSGLFRHTMRPYFAKFGISGAQWGVLRVLGHAEDEGIGMLRQADLGARLLVRPSSVTGLIDRLVRVGLVRRETDKHDLRAKHIRLTAAGRQMVGRVLRQHQSQIREVLGGLSQDDQRQLRRLMLRLGNHLETLVKPNGQTTETDIDEAAADGE
jgi:DNA-binding MarR family transcriptional regulator